MKTRCIHLFPRFPDEHKIHEIREKYDFLSTLIQPHITLVFPFKHDMSSETLRLHIEDKVNSEGPFELTTGRIEAVAHEGYYLFLCLDIGEATINKLNTNLYSEQLEEFKANFKYKAHITMGRFRSRETLMQAYEAVKNFDLTFKTTIDEVVVEEIGPNEESLIENRIKLLKPI